MLNRQQYPFPPQAQAPFTFAGTAPMYAPASASAPAPAFAPVYQAQSAQTPPPIPSGAPMTSTGAVPISAPAFEESYIENILRLNLGKMATVYMTFENNNQWNAKVFKGRLEAAGRDHIILSDPATGIRYLLLMVNLDYITFNEELNYEYPGHPVIGR